MPLYRVFAHATIYYQYLVTADDEEEATERVKSYDAGEPDVMDDEYFRVDYAEVEEEDA